MRKEFNTEGNCNPRKHYMVDLSGKLERIFSLVEKGKYFTINRPRQYGKTTILSSLSRYLLEKEGYFPIRISFEGIGSSSYQDEEKFITGIFSLIKKHFRVKKFQAMLKFMEDYPDVSNFIQLGDWVTELVLQSEKKVVLMIDEVDKSSNNQLFLDFLGMLRTKYLAQNDDEDYSFHSVILTGVHDIKTLKLKIRPQEESKFNSPWNIAADFNVDLSFESGEIVSMLEDYSQDKKVSMNISKIVEKLFYHTSGHPFLVSRICKLMDEQLMEGEEWTGVMLDQAVQQLLGEKNTNFESVIKKLEDYESLYQIVFDSLLLGKPKVFNQDNPDIYLGIIHGLFREEKGVLKIHNRIYEQRIYNYLTSKLETSLRSEGYHDPMTFLNQDGTLNFDEVLLKFQQFMKMQYTKRNKEFLEENGRLLFLAFLKPILNGKGFDFKEVETSEEKRLDVVVTFLNQKFVVELKLWKGESYHQKGLLQLADYLECCSLDQGYLLIFDLRMEKNREWKKERKTVYNKEILAIWV